MEKENIKGVEFTVMPNVQPISMAENKTLNELRDEMYKGFNNAYDDFRKQKEQILKEHVLLLAVPKIKGEITKGKMKWRGIYACSDELGEWIEQRGKVITPKVLHPTITII